MDSQHYWKLRAWVLPLVRLCQGTAGAFLNVWAIFFLDLLVLLISGPTHAASPVSCGICGWVGMIGRCSVQSQQMKSSDDAWCGWIFGDPTHMGRLFQDEKHSFWPVALFAVHSVWYQLASATSGKLPVLAEVGSSHLYNWHLQSWSCFPVGLHHLLFVVDSERPSVAKGGSEAGILGCGRLGDRATERKPWLGSAQFFQFQRRTKSKDALETSGVVQGKSQRFNAANGRPAVCLLPKARFDSNGCLRWLVSVLILLVNV